MSSRLHRGKWIYDIHGVVRIVSNVDLKNAYFEVDGVDDPNLQINVVDKINFDTSKCNKVGWSFYGKTNEGFMFTEESEAKC